MTLDRIAEMLRGCDGDSNVFPPTILYNEGWLLRLILDWFSTHRVQNHPLSFSESARWFSEALLPSAFLPRSRQDPLGEAYTHADGVIGHFEIGSRGRGDLRLLKDANHFVVLEAKMFSRLSPGVSHARYFDQAARNVACMAEVLKAREKPVEGYSRLGFYVLAPSEQLKKESSFRECTSIESIRDKVESRVEEYENLEEGGEKRAWFENWFRHLIDRIEIKCLSWEDILPFIVKQDKESGEAIQAFYGRCLQHNQPTLMKDG
jgi:hypothetical protein